MRSLSRCDVVLLAACAAAAAWGCDGDRPARAEPVGAPEDPAAADDPAAEVSLWRAEVPGIEASTARFDSVEACVAELQAQTPIPVVEGLDDLGYDGFFDQLCRSMQAVRDGDLEACDALTVSTARAGCRRRLAIVQGLPDACPTPRARDGRDPSCLAWAARDPSLCTAATESEQAACRAVFEGEGACRRLPSAARARCGALVQRYAEVVGEATPSRAPSEPRSFELVARVTGQDAVTIAGDFVDRGVRLEPEGCRWRVAMEDPSQPSIGVGSDRAHASLTLSVPAGADADLHLPLDSSSAVLTLVLPRRGGLTSIAGATGEVVLSEFEPERGGAVRGRVRGQLRTGGEFVRVEGGFSTFVRDLEPLPAGCEG